MRKLAASPSTMTTELDNVINRGLDLIAYLDEKYAARTSGASRCVSTRHSLMDFTSSYLKHLQ